MNLSLSRVVSLLENVLASCLCLSDQNTKVSHKEYTMNSAWNVSDNSLSEKDIL